MFASWRPPGRSRRPLGAVLERSWGLLEHVGSHLEASCAILSHLGGHLGLSVALLEPSWAILDAPTRRGTPRPGPGEGVGGGVNPSPKGKKGVGRKRGRAKPLTPQRAGGVSISSPRAHDDSLEDPYRNKKARGSREHKRAQKAWR